MPSWWPLFLLLPFAPSTDKAADDATVAPGPVPAEPPAVPSGMDLVYGQRVSLLGSGEPLVPLGIMSGQKHVALRSHSGLQVAFYEQGIFKRTQVRPGEPVAVTVKRAQPAERRFYLDLEPAPRDDPAKLASALDTWRGRGYASVEALDEGAVLGIGGRTIDNRELRVVLPVSTAAEGHRIAAEMYRRFELRPVVEARLLERPWGELKMTSRSAPLGTATSYARVTPLSGGLIEVADVEFGTGYAWAGREPRAYRGEIYVVVDPEGLLAVVNVLGLEAILEGVVPSELYASSPIEALKAQAVAARNQVLVKLGRRHHADPFRLCSDQHCQVYTGVSRTDPRATSAVRETAGEALFLEGRLVDTVYSSICGGHTEDNDAVWGNAADPALRGRPDFDVVVHPELAAFTGAITPGDMATWVGQAPATYCSRASLAKPTKFRWQKSMTADELNAAVRARYPELGRLRALEVSGRGRGGRVISLDLIGERNRATVLHELPIRALFGNLNSGALVIESERDAKGLLTQATFRGAGWGHGVGMCQMGAIGRAEAGQRYKDILSHYYNGGRVEKLY